MDTLRPGYTRRRVGDTRVFVWAQAQTCSSIHLCISKHIGKNILQTRVQTHTPTCSGACGHPCNHTLTDMLQHTDMGTHTGVIRCVHVPVGQMGTDSYVQGTPVWDGTQGLVWACTLDSLGHTYRCAQHTQVHAWHMQIHAGHMQRCVQTHAQTSTVSPTSCLLMPLPPVPSCIYTCQIQSTNVY